MCLRVRSTASTASTFYDSVCVTSSGCMLCSLACHSTCQSVHPTVAEWWPYGLSFFVHCRDGCTPSPAWEERSQCTGGCPVGSTAFQVVVVCVCLRVRSSASTASTFYDSVCVPSSGCMLCSLACHSTCRSVHPTVAEWWPCGLSFFVHCRMGPRHHLHGRRGHNAQVVA